MFKKMFSHSGVFLFNQQRFMLMVIALLLSFLVLSGCEMVSTKKVTKHYWTKGGINGTTGAEKARKDCKQVQYDDLASICSAHVRGETSNLKFSDEQGRVITDPEKLEQLKKLCQIMLKRLETEPPEVVFHHLFSDDVFNQCMKEKGWHLESEEYTEAEVKPFIKY